MPRTCTYIVACLIEASLIERGERGYGLLILANIDVEAKHFQKTSRKVKRQQQCKHCKVCMHVCVGL